MEGQEPKLGRGSDPHVSDRAIADGQEEHLPPELTISVIITNYNYEQYVGEAIDSVLKQTRKADEIIVLDDGSTDRSRDRIATYGNRVRAVFQSNEGIKAVSNTAYSLSTGKLVIYLDADDVLYPTALERIAQAYGAGIAKLQYDLDVVDSQRKPLGRRYCNFPGATSAQETARYFQRNGTYIWPVTSGNAYAREFLEKVMPFTPPVSHDGVLNTIAPLYGRVVTIPEALGQYRLHLNNISRVDAVGKINIVPDFASRIQIRKLELQMLREHADRLGCKLPEDILDRELVFVNYRLMARKIGLEDEGDVARSLLWLWWKGVIVAFRTPITSSARIKHLLWVNAVTIAPGPLARLLINLRYNRSHLRSSLRRSNGDKSK
jgi:glycosyltransferase involved in cell wall biosynthesis